MTDYIDYSKRPDPKDPTQPAPNLSTRNQRPGDGKLPADDLEEAPTVDTPAKQPEREPDS